MNLIMRFYELDGGRILIDGQDIAELTRARRPRAHRHGAAGSVAVRRHHPREHPLRTPESATDDEIVAAAKATYVDRFVHSLPDGYDTVLDEEASNVSAGEKQLITIARAFVAQPRVLILDEATSSVDTRTELLLQHAMAALRQGRTSFVIAHRLSTIRDADLILVMEHGDIVEQGTHDELIAAKGAYFRLYNSQFEQAPTTSRRSSRRRARRATDEPHASAGHRGESRRRRTRRWPEPTYCGRRGPVEAIGRPPTRGDEAPLPRRRRRGACVRRTVASKGRDDPCPIPLAPTWRLWLLWGVGVAAYIVSVTNRSSLSAVGVDAALRFDADASTLSMFAVIQLAVYGAMQIPVGLLLDRFGARPIITIGMALMAVGQLALAFAPDVAWAIAARMLLGAGDAAVFPSVLRVIAVWFPERQAPFLVQLTGLVGQSGQIIAVLPLAALLHATSWTIAFGSLAGLGALFTVLTFAVIRNRPPGRTADVSVDTQTGAMHVVRSSADLRQGFRESWGHPGTRLAFWSHFTTPFSGTAFVLLWGFPFLTVGEGLTPAMASLLFTVYVVFGVLVGPVIGALSSRHPGRRSRLLVLPVIGIQAAAWLAVILWPVPRRCGCCSCSRSR